MVLVAKDLLRRNPHPTEDEIREAIRGNICRCTGYTSIVRAIHGSRKYGLLLPVQTGLIPAVPKETA